MDLENMKDILVMFYTTEDRILCIDFNTSKEVSEFIETSEYFVNKVLRGKTIKGSTWKPNIFFKSINETQQLRYIVVYKEDWINYSERQRSNRIKKLMIN